MVANKIFPIHTHHPHNINIPCGPLITQGLINFHNYQIRCMYPPEGLPIAAITEALNTKYSLVDVELNNWHTVNGKEQTLHKGFAIYIRFETLEQELNFPKKAEVEGHLVFFQHRGLYTCENCNEKGHRQVDCARITRQKRRDRKRRDYARRRRAN